MKDRIKKIQESLHLTQGAFASRIGSTPATITGIYSGRTNPTLNLVYQIVEHVPGINIGWLLYGKGEMFESASQSSTLSPAQDPALSSEPEFEFSDFDVDDTTPSAPQGSSDNVGQEQFGLDNDVSSVPGSFPSAGSYYNGQNAQPNIEGGNMEVPNSGSAAGRSTMPQNSGDPSVASSMNRGSRVTGQLMDHQNGPGQSNNVQPVSSSTTPNCQTPTTRSARRQPSRYDAQQRQQAYDQEQQNRIDLNFPSEKNFDKPKRKITEIRIFFSDGTYETFEPKK